MKFVAFFALYLAFDLASALEPIFSIVEDADTSEIGNCLGDRINSCQKVQDQYFLRINSFSQVFKVWYYPSNITKQYSQIPHFPPILDPNSHFSPTRKEEG